MYENARLPVMDIAKEALSEHQNIIEFSINNGILYNAKNNKFDTLLITYIGFKRQPSTEELKRLKKWLEVRVTEDMEC